MPEFALTLLSSLPDRWDIDLWTRILMRGYELAFGYKGEFSYENAGVLGRGNEVEIQHRNATAQGGKDFALTHQEQLQSLLPPTLEFQYEERDVEGDAQEAQLQLAKAASHHRSDQMDCQWSKRSASPSASWNWPPNKASSRKTGRRCKRMLRQPMRRTQTWQSNGIRAHLSRYADIPE